MTTRGRCADGDTAFFGCTGCAARFSRADTHVGARSRPKKCPLGPRLFHPGNTDPPGARLVPRAERHYQKRMIAHALRETPRAVAYRTHGYTHGPITRLVSPSDLGELIKPFVFLD